MIHQNTANPEPAFSDMTRTEIGREQRSRDVAGSGPEPLL